MKGYLRVAAAALLLLFFTSCGSGEDAVQSKKAGSGQNQAVQKDIRLVPKKIKAKYLLPNGVEYTAPEKEISIGSKKIKVSFAQITGLKNKEIEASINKQIAKYYEDNIKKYGQNTTEEINGFYSFISCSFNNILSLELYGDRTNYSSGLLFNLTTGKKLELSDIFTKGTDYISLLNRIIIEKILEGDREESDILREPFTSIKPDQDFILEGAERLSIIFHRGQSGFADEYRLAIPLSEIDSYVDIFDREMDLDQTIYEAQNDIVKTNNIFIERKREKLTKSGCEVNTAYPVFMGFANSKAEVTINKTIKDALDEALNSKYVTGPNTSSANPQKSVSIEFDVYFNHFGYLCVTRNVYCYHEGMNAWDLFKVYTFDIDSGELVDPEEMLIDYANRNENFKNSFTRTIKNNFIPQIRNLENNNEDLIKKLEEEVDFSFIVDNGQIMLQNGYLSGEPGIVVYFPEGTIGSYPLLICANFMSEMNTSPDLFFSND